MNIRTIRSLLLLLLFFTVTNLAHAQDAVQIKPLYGDPGGFSWTLSATNGNSQSLPVNQIELKLENPGVTTFSPDGAMPSSWQLDLDPNGTTLTYSTTTSASIGTGKTLGGFKFSLLVDPADYNKPITVDWVTRNNSTPLGSGSFTLIPTDLQLLTKLDTVTVDTAHNGSDPCFMFTVFNRNSSQFAINHVAFQLLTQNAGSIRPSSVQAPAGWVIDSITPTVAYFGTTGSGIGSTKSLGGFKVCIRANPAINKFTWVWNAYEVQAPIDRDTIRNVSITPGSSSPSSCDSVTATNNGGCVYDLTLANFHASNAIPPSRITGFKLISATSGVKFLSAQNLPTGWASSVRNDSIVFAASSDAAGLPSGTIFSNLRFTVDNPAGGNFTLHWVTLRNNTEICSDNLNLKCAVSAPGADSVVLAETAPCCYKLTVRNLHNVPASSDLYAVGLQVQNAKFYNLSTAKGWTVNIPSDSGSVRFSATSAQALANGGSEDVMFCVNVTSGSNPVVTWTTYDQAGLSSGKSLSTGTINTTCTAVVGVCDTSSFTKPNNDCNFVFTITNRHTENITINKVDVTAQNGKLIAGATAPIGWQKSIDPTNTTVTFTGPGIPAIFQQGGFQVQFDNTNGTESFGAKVTTYTSDNQSCFTVQSLQCALDAVAATSAKRMTVTVAPNPFLGNTSVSYYMPADAKVTISLVDVLGRTQQTLVDSFMTEGSHQVRLDGTNLTPGTYYLRVESVVGKMTKKVVLNR